eukprot:TRINITY_DN24149_c0_g1_i1.p1 TRINITY_DN24149_c0_g1~~TRINITY_DN24149_c0_g1_i1.p1  ORF type:complete len:443 (-),score=48.71 TRINITY_DN24149_c0_g1_i1:292-1620(-)
MACFRHVQEKVRHVQEKVQEIHHKPVLPAVADGMLRAFGQVIFCNSPISGVGMLIALSYANPWLAVLATAGSLIATITAHLGKVSLPNGLAGYNGVLLGCGFAHFLDSDDWTWQPILATGLGAVTTVLLSVAMKAMSKVPIWTFPFNIALLCTLMYTTPLGKSEAADKSAYLDLKTISAAGPVGVAQVFVVNDWVSGVIVIISIAVYSPMLSASCLIGSVIGLATALAIEEVPSAISAGLCGYNSALTACAIYTFFAPTKESFLLILLSSALTQVLASSLAKAAAATFQIPVGTLPFCIAATLCYMLLGNVKGLRKPADTSNDEKACELDLECGHIAAAVVGTPIRPYCPGPDASSETKSFASSEHTSSRSYPGAAALFESKHAGSDEHPAAHRVVSDTPAATPAHSADINADVGDTSIVEVIQEHTPLGSRVHPSQDSFEL